MKRITKMRMKTTIKTKMMMKRVAIKMMWTAVPATTIPALTTRSMRALFTLAKLMLKSQVEIKLRMNMRTRIKRMRTVRKMRTRKKACPPLRKSRKKKNRRLLRSRRRKPQTRRIELTSLFLSDIKKEDRSNQGIAIKYRYMRKKHFNPP